MDFLFRCSTSFYNEPTQIINFREQISYGIELAKQKLHTIENQIRHAEQLQKEIDRSDAILSSDTPLYFGLPEKNCWIVPVRGQLTEQTYYSAVHRLLRDIQNFGGNASGCETGILCRWDDAEYQQYIFADVDVSYGRIMEDTRFFHIPAQSYLCKKAEFASIHDPLGQFLEILQSADEKIVILSELFNSSFDYKNPRFELRCSTSKRLTDKQKATDIE